MTLPPAPLTYLSWDSAALGVPVAALAARDLSAGGLPAIAAWRSKQSYGLVQLLCDGSDRLGQHLAQSHGFRHLDTRLTLEMPLDDLALRQMPDGFHIRCGAENDAETICDFGPLLFERSRYFWDPHFSRDKVIELHRQWLVNALTGRYDDGVLLICNDQDQAVGFCTLKFTPPSARIGLFGIAETYVGLGLGGALLSQALAHMQEQACSVARVATQARNIAALRLYQRLGFSVAEVHEWFHLWLEDLPCDFA